jgi:rSAM/selenodomain-associated transferase 1
MQEREMSMSDTALVVMARYPQAGQTKTRLARSIGDHAVAGLYRAFLGDLAQHLTGQNWDFHWAYTPAEVDYQAFVAELLPAQARHMHCFAQEGSDFGLRLHNAFKWTHAQGFRRTVLISSDSPHISPECIARARTELDSADVVLGPCDDGGYYLIAMREPYDVFSGIPMSTSVVKQMTIEAAERQGLRVSLLEPLFDVDELPDLQRLDHLLSIDSSLAPLTAAYMLTIRNQL